MRLTAKLVIRVKNGFLPHLINEIYKRNCSTRNIVLLENEHGNDTFLLEILYSNQDKYTGLLGKIEKYKENFQIISSENILEKEIMGGMLNISGKMPVTNLIDYKMNVLGATELSISMLQTGENILKYSGISKNIGLFCGISSGGDSEKNRLGLYALAERDSIIINRFTGLNSYPMLVKLNQPDDLIRILRGIEATFSAIRIFSLEDIDDIALYQRIFDEVSLPIISQYYDEIPLYLLISISHLLNKNNFDYKNCTVGIIGITISSLRLVRLMIKQGFLRILGCDSNIKLMHTFEKEGGLATTPENIIGNSDLIIIFKDQFGSEDVNKLGSGQILISLSGKELETAALKERGVKDFLQSGWLDLSVLFPGILKGLIEHNLKYLDDDKLIKLANKITELKQKDEILPNVFSEVHQRIPELIGEL